MKEQTQNGLAWIMGAMVVVATIALYLWITQPTEPLLPKTYTVM